MGCEITKIAGMGVILCSRGSGGRRMPKGQTCRKRPGKRQCDYSKPGSTKTCDKYICKECTVTIALEIDYCPDHPR